MPDESRPAAGATVYSHGELERFIPVSRQEVIRNLVRQSGFPEEEAERFRRFAAILSALYHFRFQEDLERLKEAYRPFSPDPDLVTKRNWSDEEIATRRREFVDALAKVLNDANYEEITLDEINRALRERSPYGLTVSVDLGDFDEFRLFCRGLAIRHTERRTWKKLFLGKERFEVPVYRRLALLVKLKTGPGAEDGERARRRRVDRPEEMDEGAIYLKLFKDIPRSDLEMLFPNPRVRMRVFDKLRVGVTGGGATAYGAYKVIGNLAAAGSAIGAGTIGVLFGFFALLGRQITKIFNLRTQYLVKLSRNLYLHNMDNNAGVFTHLIDLAEEEECKEAVLAYGFLLTDRDREHDAKSLDERIQKYVEQEYGIPLDFEVEDSLRKLRERGLLKESDNGALSVLPLPDACEQLDREWDNVFPYHRPDRA